MSVGDYNKGKSVSDLDIKDWSYGHASKLRSDSTWQDDRYDPIKFSHPHRYDNVNFKEQEYKDVFGGTAGDAERLKTDKHYIGLFSGTSTAMLEAATKKRKSAIKVAAEEIDLLNKKED